MATSAKSVKHAFVAPGSLGKCSARPRFPGFEAGSGSKSAKPSTLYNVPIVNNSTLNNEALGPEDIAASRNIQSIDEEYGSIPSNVLGKLPKDLTATQFTIGSSELAKSSDVPKTNKAILGNRKPSQRAPTSDDVGGGVPPSVLGRSSRVLPATKLSGATKLIGTVCSGAATSTICKSNSISQDKGGPMHTILKSTSPMNTAITNDNIGEDDLQEHDVNDVREDSPTGTITKRKRNVNAKSRGVNKCKRVASLREGEKLEVHIFNNGPVGEGSTEMTRHIGKLIRDCTIVPVRVHDWDEIDDGVKEHLYQSVLNKFQGCERDLGLSNHSGSAKAIMAKLVWSNEA